MKKLKRLIPGRRHTIPADVLTGYAHWAKNYPPTAHNPLMKIEQEAMLSLLPDDLTGQICLDLACGSGRYIHLLQQRHARQVIGLDYSPNMLAAAVNPPSPHLPISPSPHYQLTHAPFFPLPFPNSTFDLITCGLAVGHEQNLPQTLAEVGRVLRPGGFVLYSDIHPFGALLGWQRSFTADDGTVFNLEHHLHLYRDHQQACRAAGLAIDVVLEPKFGKDVSANIHNIPAILVIRAIKTG